MQCCADLRVGACLPAAFVLHWLLKLAVFFKKCFALDL